jgi:hypothetical protein
VQQLPGPFEGGCQLGEEGGEEALAVARRGAVEELSGVGQGLRLLLVVGEGLAAGVALKQGQARGRQRPGELAEGGDAPLRPLLEAIRLELFAGLVRVEHGATSPRLKSQGHADRT